MNYPVSVVIPTYNGLELLQKNLPPLLAALARYGGAWEIIVVDDASCDNTVPLLRSDFPEVCVLRNESNRGFAETMNRGIFSAKHDVILALNNDVAVTEGLFTSIVPRFGDPDIFAISPNIVDPRTNKNQAIYRLRKTGFCWFYDVCLDLSQIRTGSAEIPLFFASGGSSFFSREKLLLLGGFDPIYKPFYFEDVDLSYRAWKCGWKCLLEPEVTVFHEINSTIGKLNKRRKIKFLAAKNKVMFLWLNVTDFKLEFFYMLFFLPSLIWDILSFRKYKLVGTFMALAQLPVIIPARRARKALFRVTDAEIIRKVSLKHEPGGDGR